MAVETDYVIGQLLAHREEDLTLSERVFLQRVRGAWLSNADKARLRAIAERVRLSEARGPMQGY